MTLEIFFEKFELFVDAPNAVGKMRELVLHLAFAGKLLPAGEPWPLKPLKSLTTKIGSGSTPRGGRESYFTEGIPFIRSMNVHFAGFEPKGLVFLSDEQANQLANVAVQSADVLLNITGASIGRVTTAPNEMAGARVNQHVAIIRPIKELDPQFLAKFLASPSVQRKIDDVQVGATREALTKGMIEQFQIPLPPLAEQKRIVAKVDELMALCDRLEAQQQEQEARHAALARASLARFAEAPTPANLEFLFHKFYAIPPADLRKSILTLAVQGKLVPQDPEDEPAEELIDRLEKERAHIAKEQSVRPRKNIPELTADNYPHDIPESWKWRRIGHLALVVDYGTSQKSDNDSSKVPVYRMGDIVGGKLVDDNLKYVDASIDDLPGLYLKTNDILFNRTNSYELVGKTGIYTGPDDVATFASYLIRIRLPSAYLFPAFFSIAMNAPYFRQTQIEPDVVQQCGQANFNGTKLASTVVPIPPLAEQRRIVAKVDELMTLVDALETQLATARTAATNLLAAAVAELTASNAPNKGVAKTNTNNADPTNSGEFIEALVIAQLTRGLSEPKYPLGRMRYNKLAYLSHRLAGEDVTKHYIKKAAGPYSPWAKFDGPEDIAIEKGFVRRGEHGEYKGLLPGDAIGEIDRHLSEHPVCQAVDQILSTFGRTTNDELELLATVDFAVVDLRAAGKAITPEAVEKVIASNKDWAPKLERQIFSKANLKRALKRLEQVFPRFYGERA